MLSLLLCTFAWAANTNAELNPVTRVAELLENLAKKVHTDGEAEQELYDKYKCWCTKVIDTKSASIDSNSARISELTSYIDDLSSGRIELTSERSDMEKEIAGLEKTIADETEMRETEKANYEAAKDEMDKAVAALGSAVTTLAAGMNSTSLTGVKSELKHAVQLGSGFLAKRDVSALMKVLQGQDPELDVPDVDWEKLNRDATFKKKYDARSGGILDILKDMEATFVDNRDAAIEAEEKAVSDFEALIGAKGEALAAAKQALLDKAKEKGARAEALAVAEAEKEDREGQNDRDTGFLADTKSACETKAADWSERKRLRAEEIASINEAISVLRSDDARDTFKKSMDSQGYLFLQLEKKKHRHTRRSLALSTIRKVAATTKDTRFAALSTLLAATKQEPSEVDEANPFPEVIAGIDDMLSELSAEEADDLAKKEHCEKERMEKTQEAKMTSKEIDTNVETIDRLTAEITAQNKSIVEIDAQVEDLEKEKRDAGDQRAKENAEFVTAKADDTQAVELIQTAIGALEGFYERNGLSFASLTSVRRVQQEPFVEAGEAPTPPPSTFEGGYGGSKGESTGIIAILGMIKTDIESDIAKSEKTEEESVAAYDALVADTDASISSLQTTKSDLESSIAEDETSMASEKTTKATNQENLDSTLAFLKELAPGCDFIAVNFDTRLKNRQTETDGLNKAKAILEGASFA
jgi:hypothetical protein